MISAMNESILDRLSGVITLRRATYEALQRDPGASTQALLIVLFLGLANGIALVTTPLLLVTPDMSDDVADAIGPIAAMMTFDTTEKQIAALVVGMAGGVISWVVSSWVLGAIGNRVTANRTKVSSTEMRRLVGWGYAPSLASFFTPIPIVGPLLALAGTLWAFVTGIMALRVAFGIGIWKAIAIEIAAFLVILVIVLALAFITVVFALAAS